MQIHEILQVMPLFLNHSNAAVAIKDIDGFYLLANQAYCRYLGQPLDIITGQRDDDLLARERCESIHDNEMAAINGFKGVSGIESGADLHYAMPWCVPYTAAFSDWLEADLPVRWEPLIRSE